MESPALTEAEVRALGADTDDHADLEDDGVRYDVEEHEGLRIVRESEDDDAQEGEDA